MSQHKPGSTVHKCIVLWCHSKQFRLIDRLGDCELRFEVKRLRSEGEREDVRLISRAVYLPGLVEPQSDRKLAGQAMEKLEIIDY